MLVFCGIHCAVYALLPFFFFCIDAYLFSFVWILLLLDLVVLTAKCFSNVDEFAGKLLIFYLAWMIYAVYLNGAYLFFDLTGKIQ